MTFFRGISELCILMHKYFGYKSAIRTPSSILRSQKQWRVRPIWVTYAHCLIGCTHNARWSQWIQQQRPLIKATAEVVQDTFTLEIRM